MKRIFCILAACLVSLSVMGQGIQGMVTDTLGQPVPYTTVSLLDPQDSTLAFFAITNTEGSFDITNVKPGRYLLQAAFIGFRTYYQPVSFPPANSGNVGHIVLRHAANELEAVEVSTAKVPLLIKGDTVEYNAGAFKAKPDASVEELIRKMPGMDVDRAGNIKAQGQTVSKVLVDGKEFFGDDPKVATRNLPADAIKKVQVFNKKSDAAEFTGIDDGSRERTINLMLKDGKKSGYFGDVAAGGGTDERYKLDAKLYRFTKKSQFAALGLMNNINKAGFSVSDYINFSGGIRNLLSAGSDNLQRLFANAPVDFGQPVTGHITSGAAGLNYSYEYGTNKRVGLSYLGSGADKKQDQQAYTQNFTNGGTFERNSTEYQDSRNYAHKLNLNWRHEPDTSQQINVYGHTGLTQSKALSEGMSTSLVRDVMLNQMDSKTNSTGNGVSANGIATYLKRLRGKMSVLNLSANANYNRDISNADWQNITRFLGTVQPVVDKQFQNTTQDALDYGMAASGMYRMQGGFYLEPKIEAGSNVQHLWRQQGPLHNEAVVIDSLSPDFKRSYGHVRPGLSVRRSLVKKQYGISLAVEQGYLLPQWTHAQYQTRRYTYLLPAINWQYEYSLGKRLNFDYTSSVSAPGVRQLLPAPTITSPLNRSIGNTNLRPEYRHDASFGWLWFDQFSNTSLFANLRGAYTQDKINISRYILPDLSEIQTYENVTDDYRADGSFSFSRPVRRLGLILKADVGEHYNRGINLVNGVNNLVSTFTHELKIQAGNRKKEKFDMEAGGSISLSDARYSIDNQLNNVFFSITAFTDISYTPNDKWYIGINADITQYNARSFREAILVPLIRSEVSYYFMKANRAVLTLEGFDLLNKNKSIQRISELNYLSEVRSNIIGQYFMLSFKYRLSMTGKDANMIDTGRR